MNITEIIEVYKAKYLNPENYVSGSGPNVYSFKAENVLCKFEITFIDGQKLIVVMTTRQRDMVKRTKHYQYIKTIGGLGYVKEKPATVEEIKEEKVQPIVKKQACLLSYDKLMSHNPTVYTSLVNQLGQTIELVEHPLRGDEAEVIAVCHELQLAAYTSFFECDDMLEDHKEYEPSFRNGMFFIGDLLN